MGARGALCEHNRTVAQSLHLSLLCHCVLSICAVFRIRDRKESGPSVEGAVFLALHINIEHKESRLLLSYL